MMPAAPSRGLRNNNPGNIRRVDGQTWQGELYNDTSDPRYDATFEQFTSPVWGIRAMAKLLLKYQDRYGCDTVRKLISKWAPPNENDTEGYINHAADATGLQPDQTVVLAADEECFCRLLQVIIKHENGAQPYEPGLIKQAIAMAKQGRKV